MSANTKERGKLGEDQQRQFAALILIERVASEPGRFHAALMEKEDDELLDKLFKYLMSEELAQIGEDDHYALTERGQKAFQNMLHQQQSYLAHFDIFARVDLAEGAFADLDDDYLDDPRWEDLRVAVAEYKGIDPYRMVFLAMLAEGRFFENPDWKFDIALGSSFFTELEEIVATQVSLAELGYVAEDGGRVSGDAVIEDVIVQGSTLNRERMEREGTRQQSLLDDDREDQPSDNGQEEYDEWVMVPYDPWMPMAAYAGSALFVESLWLSRYW